MRRRQPRAGRLVLAQVRVLSHESCDKSGRSRNSPGGPGPRGPAGLGSGGDPLHDAGHQLNAASAPAVLLAGGEKDSVLVDRQRDPHRAVTEHFGNSFKK